jgi:hypothetical protein
MIQVEAYTKVITKRRDSDDPTADAERHEIHAVSVRCLHT